MLRLDLDRPLVGRLLLQVDVLDDPEHVVGVDHVLGGAARPPGRRLRREVRLLVAPRQGRAVHRGVVLSEIRWHVENLATELTKLRKCSTVINCLTDSEL